MSKKVKILILATLGFAGLFSVANLSQAQAQVQNVTSGDLDAIRTSLDQAIATFNGGDLRGTLQQLDRTEDQMDIVEDRLEFQLGFDD